MGSLGAPASWQVVLAARKQVLFWLPSSPCFRLRPRGMISNLTTLRNERNVAVGRVGHTPHCAREKAAPRFLLFANSE